MLNLLMNFDDAFKLTLVKTRIIQLNDQCKHACTYISIDLRGKY